MPRSDRRIFNFRLSERGHTWLDDLVAETGTDKSTVARLALVVARRHEAELKLLLKERTEEA